MGSDKNTPNEENAPEDTSPKEHNALDRKSPIENHSEQEKEVAQSTSGAWFARLKRLSGFRGPILKSQWLRNVGVSLFVTALFAGAQLCLANNQANTAERLENLRYVRERSQVTTPIDLSPQCLRTGEFILTPESTTTNSSADDKDHFTPELPFKDFDLKGQNLSGLWLNCANFSEANLEGADLSNTYLIGANLSGANLRNANLKHSQLQLARLENADLSGADLSGANLSGTPTDLSILETATLCETTLPEDNLGLTQQQKERLQELGATFTKEEDEEP
ncbi:MULTISPECIES: pentapeptide repeat-containing protein [Corynebacterium]|uniref:pentapeptide repeat-containing protein n=1 Tax=Corynebacterium TaxID=1716 RepID=UPI0009BBA4CD|nr:MULTISPECIES: pentapeptide repeat-containing protein [Corynebacterium]MDK6814191.1 pentapeptide repeat-containing protein [Corynebacterium sp. UMB6689]